MLENIAFVLIFSIPVVLVFVGVIRLIKRPSLLKARIKSLPSFIIFLFLVLLVIVFILTYW